MTYKLHDRNIMNQLIVVDILDDSSPGMTSAWSLCNSSHDITSRVAACPKVPNEDPWLDRCPDVPTGELGGITLHNIITRKCFFLDEPARASKSTVRRMSGAISLF